MKNSLLIHIVAAVTSLGILVPVGIVPARAEAHRYERHGGVSTGAAVAIGLGAVGLGYAVGSRTSGYQAGYRDSYRASAGSAYAPTGYGYRDGSYPYQDGGYLPSAPAPAARAYQRDLPPPNGVRCLVWDGRAYVPTARC